MVLFISGVAKEIELERRISAVIQSLFHSVSVRKELGQKQGSRITGLFTLQPSLIVLSFGH